MTLSASPTAALAPDAIVTRFLHALEIRDHATIEALLAPELRYTNVSLPTLRGGRRVANVLGFALRFGGFQVRTHRLAVNGDTVLTERTDIITVGPLHVSFWVCGTFEVREGRIVLWRDYFDWWALTKGLARAVATAPLPRLRAQLPAGVDA